MEKRTWSKVLSLLLALALCVGMLPADVLVQRVYAAEKTLSPTITGGNFLSASTFKTSGTVNWKVSGTTLKSGNLASQKKDSTSVLTWTLTPSSNVRLSYDFSLAEKSKNRRLTYPTSAAGTASKDGAKNAVAAETITIDLNAGTPYTLTWTWTSTKNNTNAGTASVTNIKLVKLEEPVPVTIVAQGGDGSETFTIDGVSGTSANLAPGVAHTFVANSATKRIEGWYIDDVLQSSDTSASIVIPEKATTVKAVFIDSLPDGVAMGSSGNYPWEHIGGGVFASSNQEKNKSSSIMTLTFEANEGDVLSFRWQVSSEEECDKLTVEATGAETAKLVNGKSGSTGVKAWSGAGAVVTRTLKEGSYTITCTYKKDKNTAEGADTAWIGDITLTRAGTPHVLTVSKQPVDGKTPDGKILKGSTTVVDAASATGTTKVIEGKTGVLTAADGTAYKFDHWESNANAEISGATLTYNMGAADDTVTAVYTAKTPTSLTVNVVNTSTNDNGTPGSVTATGATLNGATLNGYVGNSYTLTANANTNYIFDGWYEGDTLKTTATALSDTFAAGSKTLTAKFHKAATVVVTPTLNSVTLKYNTTNSFGSNKGTAMTSGTPVELKEGTYYFQFTCGSDAAISSVTLNGTEVKSQLSNNVLTVKLNKETYGGTLAISATAKGAFDAVLGDSHITGWESYHISDSTNDFIKGTDSPVWKYAGTSQGTPVIYSGVDYNTPDYTTSILVLTIQAEAAGDILYFDYANAGQNDWMAVVDYDAYMALDNGAGKKGFGVLYNYYPSDGHVSASSSFGNADYAAPPSWLYVLATGSLYTNDLYGDGEMTRNYGKTLDNFTFREQKAITLHAGTNRIAFISMKNTGASSNRFGFYIKNISVSHVAREATVTLSYSGTQGSVTVDGTPDTTGTYVSNLGDSHTFAAAGEAGYVFDGWYDAAGKLLTRDSEYTAVISADVTLQPKFTALSSVLPAGVTASVEGSTWLVSGSTLYASNTARSDKETEAKLILTVPKGYKYFSFDVSHRGYFTNISTANDKKTDYMLERPTEYTAISADGATPNGYNIYANIKTKVSKTVEFAFEDIGAPHTVTVLYHRTSNADYAGNQSIVSNFKLSNDAPASGVVDSGAAALSRAFTGSVSGLTTTGDAKWYWDGKYNAVASGNPSEKTNGGASTSSLFFTLPAGATGLFWDEMYNRMKEVHLEVYLGGTRIFDDNKHPSYVNGYSAVGSDCVTDGEFVRRELSFAASNQDRTVEFRVTNDRANSSEHYNYGGYQTYWLKNISWQKLYVPAATFIAKNDSNYTRISTTVTNLRFPADQTTTFMLASGPEDGIEGEAIHVSFNGSDVTDQIVKGLDQDWTYTTTMTGGTARTLSFYFTAPGYLPSETYTVNLLPDASGLASSDWPSVSSVNAAAGAHGWVRNASYNDKVAYLPENTGVDNSDAVMTVILPSPGTVTFAYRTSSEAGYDKLIVTDAAGSTLMEASGEMTAWQTKTVQVTAATGNAALVNFIYHKDSGSAKGEDRAAIADVTFSGSTATLSVGLTSDSGSYGTAVRTDSGTLYVGSVARIAATAASDGKFYGWYDAASNGNLLSSEPNFAYTVGKPADAIYARFGAANAWEASIGSTLYSTLKSAFAAAKTGETVTLVQNVTVSESLTVPAGVTLLVPCSGDDTGYSATGYNYDNEVLYGNNNYSGKALYRTLTIAEGATLTVDGTLLVNSVSGRAAAGHFDQDITGGYGQIVADGNIVVNGKLDNFGYITGGGTVTANSGGAVGDMYVVRNWRGGSQAASMYMSDVYPMNEYEQHNITAKLVVKSGAAYTGLVKMFASGSYYYARFPQVDNANGLIRLNSGAVLTKEYQNGREKHTITGGASFAGSSLDVAGTILSTADYVYPINGIYDFTLSGGDYTFTESYKFMPGATMTVGSGATLTINSDKTVVFYDSFRPSDPANTDNTQYPASRGAALLKLEEGAKLDNKGSFAGTIQTDSTDIGGSGWTVQTKEANGYYNGVRTLSFDLTINGTKGDAAGSVWSYNADKSIRWAEHEVTFDFDNGAATRTASVAHNGKATKPEDPQKEGYTFEGWYLGDAPYDFDKPVIGALALKARWSEKKFTAAFDANGGEAAQTSLSVAYNAAYGDLPAATRTGYTFAGWWTAPAGGSEVMANTVCSVTSDHTVYAHWTPNQYTVSFDANGGSTPLDSRKVAYGEKYGELPTPIRAGYAFAGWTLANEGGGTVTSITPVSTDHDHVLIAAWNAKGDTPYTVQHYTEDVYGAYSLYKAEEASGVTGATVSAAPMGIPGFSHVDGHPETVSTGVIEPDGSLVLKLYYSRNSYSITYMDGNASIAAPETHRYGEPVTLYPYQKTGYDFLGWYVDAGLSEEASIVEMPYENLVLYAKLTPQALAVSFDANGGEPLPAENGWKTVLYDETYGGSDNALPVPMRVGYGFAGWWTDVENGTEVTASTAVRQTGVQTLYAHWNINHYDVTLRYVDVNGTPITSEAVQSVAYGSVVSSADKAINGWYFVSAIPALDAPIMEDMTVITLTYASYLDRLTMISVDQLAAESTLAEARLCYEQLNDDQFFSYDGTAHQQALLAAIESHDRAALDAAVRSEGVSGANANLVNGNDVLASLTMEGNDLYVRVISKEVTGMEMRTIRFLAPLFAHDEVMKLTIRGSEIKEAEEPLTQNKIMLALAGALGIDITQENANTPVWQLLDGADVEAVMTARSPEGVEYALTYRVRFFNNEHEATWVTEDGIYREIAAYGDTLTPPEASSVGKTLAGWSTDPNATDSFAPLTMGTGDVTLYAIFRDNAYRIAIGTAENGSVAADRDSAIAGENVTISATPAEGYELSGITVTSEGGRQIATTAESGGRFVFAMPVGDVTVTAGFKAVVVVPTVPPTVPPATTPTVPPATTGSDTESRPSAPSDASTSDATVSMDGSTVKTTQNSDGSTTTTTTSADGSSEVVSKTTETHNADGSTTSATVVEGTSVATTKEGSKTLTETHSEVKETLDSSGNGQVEVRKTETVKSEDGKVTTTTVTESRGTVETASDGTKTTITMNKAKVIDASGNESTTITAEKTVETADGSHGNTISDETGKTIFAEAIVSEKAVENAAKAEQSIKVPVEVKAAKNLEDAAPVNVKLPENSGSVKVEIPVENLTSGTVAVIVREDGTEEIVKTSTTSADGVALTLDGSVTVKIVDNTKSFPDVDTEAWYAQAISWASSHEVMNGTGKGFEPGANATRAQITQLLMNLDGARPDGDIAHFSDVREKDWYADSVTWAVENGIAQGEGNAFGAAEDATREQFVVMLYNYARRKERDIEVSADFNAFPDVENVSAWARDAVTWAVGAGMLRGSTDADGSQILNPQGEITRAQIATIMTRFCKKVLS